MSEDLSGQVVVVTGAAQGIGRAIVQAFAGARVWALDIDPAGGDISRDQQRGCAGSEAGHDPVAHHL